MNQAHTASGSRELRQNSADAIRSSEPKSGFYAIRGGVSVAFFSAFVTALLLLVNGSLALILMESLAGSGPDWMYRKGLLQFALFTFPLLMVVAQWIVWDFVRGLLTRDTSAEDRWNST